MNLYMYNIHCTNRHIQCLYVIYNIMYICRHINMHNFSFRIIEIVTFEFYLYIINKMVTGV